MRHLSGIKYIEVMFMIIQHLLSYRGQGIDSQIKKKKTWRGCSSEISDKNLKSTRISSDGRGLNICTYSKVPHVIFCHIFQLGKNTAIRVMVVILDLSTQNGTNLKILTPKTTDILIWESLPPASEIQFLKFRQAYSPSLPWCGSCQAVKRKRNLAPSRKVQLVNIFK